MRDRVAIIVSGGVVQDVVCDQPHDVLLIDYDNIAQGDDIVAYPCTVNTNAADLALKEARDKVRLVRKGMP